MAEGQDVGAPAQEPSMEEILASIRKIISDDDGAVPVEAAAVAAPPPVEDDVLELTQIVQDDGSIVDAKDEPIEEPVPPLPSPPVSEPVMTKPPSLEPEKPLVSEDTVTASASALSSLASTMEIERISASPIGATYLGHGGRTLEDMVIELMRPLLKEWLEQKLPATVDRLVQKEIERIVRKSQS